MDSDNLGRIFAPTLFRSLDFQLPSTSSTTMQSQSQSSNVDPMMAFVEVNLQKTILKHLLSVHMNKNTVLKLSTIKLTDKMLTRFARGNTQESEENEENSENKDIESENFERKCIVSYDLRKSKFNYSEVHAQYCIRESEIICSDNDDNNNNNNNSNNNNNIDNDCRKVSGDIQVNNESHRLDQVVEGEVEQEQEQEKEKEQEKEVSIELKNQNEEEKEVENLADLIDRKDNENTNNGEDGKEKVEVEEESRVENQQNDEQLETNVVI